MSQCARLVFVALAWFPSWRWQFRLPAVRRPTSASSSRSRSSSATRSRSPTSATRSSIFGELGMQEFESTKLLEDTLKAAGFRVELGGAGMPTNLWAEWGEGRPKIAIVTELDALPGGSQTPGAFARKPLVKDGARPHGRPQHPWRRRLGRGLRGQAGDAALQHPGHGRALLRSGRGAAREPAVPGARRLLQGRRCHHLSAHRRSALDRVRRAELCGDQLAVHLPRQDRARLGQSVGRQGRGRRRRADGDRASTSCASICGRPIARIARSPTAASSPTSSPTRARSGGSCATPRCRRRRRTTTAWSRSPKAPR